MLSTLTDVSIEQLGSGDALLLDTKQCYAMIGAGGIFMMSDGKISAYLGEAHKPGKDIYMKDDLTLLQSGKVEELKEEAYPLISGVCQIGESAEQVTEYFEEGTPFPMEKGVKLMFRMWLCISWMIIPVCIILVSEMV